MPDTALTAADTRSATARNPLKHGLRAESIVIPSEDEHDWHDFVETTIDQYAPQSVVERALALRVAELFWRLRRAARAERDQIVEHESKRSAQARAAQERGWGNTAQKPVPALPSESTMNAVMRYEAHLSRQLFQTLHELEAIQLLRRGKAAPLARVQVHNGTDE